MSETPSLPSPCEGEGREGVRGPGRPHLSCCVSFTSRANTGGASSPVAPIKSLGSPKFDWLMMTNNRPFCALVVNPCAITISNRIELAEAIA